MTSTASRRSEGVRASQYSLSPEGSSREVTEKAVLSILRALRRSMIGGLAGADEWVPV